MRESNYKEDNFISYLVCHMDKYKRDDILGIERENERDENYKPTKNPDIDLSRASGNYHIVQRDCSYTSYINQRIKELAPKRKVKDDAVLICSFILGSNKEFFEELTYEEQQAFFYECTMFFAKRYGSENIISAVVHVDETSPHMHLNMIPVLDGRLCAKQLFDRVRLQELQTDFHEAVGKRWGLQRGKEGSKAKHKTTAEYKAEIIGQARQQANQIKQEAQDFLSEVHGTVEDAKNKPIPKKKKAVEAEIESLRTENAALKKDLEIKNRDSANLFNLLQEAEKKARHGEMAVRIVLDMETAYPDEFHALRDKSRTRLAGTKFTPSNKKGGNTK